MRTSILSVIMITLILNVTAQDEAQWRGPNRDGIYPESGLLKTWPALGPKLLWHYDELGEGHASAAIAQNTVFTAGSLNGKGFVIAFNLDGTKKWKTEYGDEWTESWPGVRSTPLIKNNKLYIMSGFGKISCLNATTGTLIWSVDLMNVYGARNITWGFTENLVILDDKLFCTPGGVNANVIALNKDTGALIWKNKGNGEKSAYCSPTIIKHNNKYIFVTMTENSILGFDAGNGTMLWRHEQTNQYSVHANTPLYHNGMLYCLSGYGKGGVMLKISDDGTKVTEVWRDSKLDSRMGGVVLIDGKIFGSGDMNRNWYCLDWNTGKELYSSTFMTKGNLIYADGLLYCYSEGGEVGIVEPLANEFKLINKFKILYGTAQHWAHLVIANKKLYVRHGNSLMVYDIAN